MVGWLVRIVAFAAGSAALYAGILLYPDEQGRAQNKLEEWWVIFDDQQKVALSKAALFMRATASLTGRLLAGIFGEKLISFQAITVSVCFSMASFALVFRVLGSDPAWLVVVLTFMSLGALSVLFAWSRILAVGFLVIWFFFPGYLAALGFGMVILVLNSFLLAIILAGGLLSDILFVTLTRLVLRWTEHLALPMACFIVFFGDAAVGVLLYITPVIAFFHYTSAGGRLTVFELIGATNAFAFLISLFLTLVAITLLLHRVLWPTAARLLYAVTPSKTQRVLLVTVGSSLLTFALGKPLSGGLIEVLRSLSSSG
jgi:hypothetical protein